jgi:exopolysaccharide production protein ExoZ
MQHFRSIHYLRGIAAVIVVIFHICATFPSLDPNLAYTFWLQSGVDIFFIISGFVMIMSTRNGIIETRNFIFDRAVRIIPIYWIITLFAAFSVSKIHMDMLVPSMLFMPVHDPKTGALISAIIPPAWTLNLEVFFYLIFAVLLNLSYQKKLICFLAIFVMLMAANIALPSPALGFYANPIIIEFWLGMLLARYHHFGRWWMLPIGIALLSAQPSALSSIMPPFTAGAFLVVAGMVSMEKWMKEYRGLRAIGDASYVLYLVHMMMIIVAYAIFGGLLNAAPALFFLSALALSVVTALLVHRFIEQPLISSIKRRWAATRNQREASNVREDSNGTQGVAQAS